jgi:proteasome-associated ATPase
VNRPNKEGAREIYRIYLTDHLPYDSAVLEGTESKAAAIDALVGRLLETQFSRKEDHRLLEVTLRSGRKEALFRSDVISGAIIASIVERAKGMAIKRAIASGKEEGISEADLQVAYNAEYSENEILPATDITEDWLKLIDYDPDNVVKISPVRMVDRVKAKPGSGVI